MRFLPCVLLCWLLVPAALAQPPEGSVALSVPLLIDGELQDGMVGMVIAPEGDRSLVAAAPLIEALRGWLPDEALAALRRATVDDYLPLPVVAATGIGVHFDEHRVVLLLNVPSESRRERVLSVRPSVDPFIGELVGDTPVSAYLNLRGNQEFIVRGRSGEAGDEYLRVGLDGAISFHGFVLEGSADYHSGSDRGWRRGDLRLVRDFPEAMVRAAAGDLAYPLVGFQGFQPMAGITVARHFELQPYRVSTPSGRTAFFLRSPSRVDVLVNGQRVQSLQLDAGPFDLRNFPLMTGSNAVELVMTDAAGRMEVQRLDLVSGAELLDAGLHEFAYNLGVPSDTFERGPRYAGDPVFSGFHRYGLGEALTIGANAQAGDGRAMLGLDLVAGLLWGIWGVELAGSRAGDGRRDVAAGLRYAWVNHGGRVDWGRFAGARTFTARAEYRGPRFATLGAWDLNNRFAGDISWRYSRQWTPILDTGLGGHYQWGRDRQPDNWGLSFSVNRLLPFSLRAGLTVEHSQENGTGLFASLWWTPPNSRQALSASYDHHDHLGRVDWTYAEDGRSNSFSATAGLAQSDAGREVTGEVTYYNNRAELTAWQDMVRSFDHEGHPGSTRLTRGLYFGTALAYSGGRLAVSRPIGNSFVMVAKHKALADHPIGINALEGRDGRIRYEATVDRLGPAVLPDVTPYLYRSLRLHAEELPAGFDTGSGLYTVRPGYRSGTLIEIGSDANVLLEGVLRHGDGSPVTLEAGVLVPEGGGSEDEQTFFTNREGLFSIEAVRPGRYTLELFRYPGQPLALEVAAEAVGRVWAGELVLPAPVEVAP